MRGIAFAIMWLMYYAREPGHCESGILAGKVGISTCLCKPPALWAGRIIGQSIAQVT